MRGMKLRILWSVRHSRTRSKICQYLKRVPLNYRWDITINKAKNLLDEPRTNSQIKNPTQMMRYFIPFRWRMKNTQNREKISNLNYSFLNESNIITIYLRCNIGKILKQLLIFLEFLNPLCFRVLNKR